MKAVAFGCTLHNGLPVKNISSNYKKTQLRLTRERTYAWIAIELLNLLYLIVFQVQNFKVCKLLSTTLEGGVRNLIAL